MSLLGLRGLKCKEHHSSAMVAAVSTWMHLGKFSLSFTPNPFPFALREL